jgi:hypothetical protein
VNSSDAGITGSGSAGQVAYFTGATTQAGSNNLFWDATNNRLGILTNTPTTSFHINSGASTQGGAIFGKGSYNYATVSQLGSSGDALFGAGVIASATAGEVAKSVGDVGHYIKMQISDGITFHTNITGTTGTSLARSTNERARFFASTGNFGINTGATDSGQRLQVVGTGYFSDSVGIGSTSLTGINLNLGKTITGATTAYGILQQGTIQTDVTSAAYGFRNLLNTAASLSLSGYSHIRLGQSTIGAGTAITTHSGIEITDLTTGTNIYAITSAVSSGTGKWNLYMNGTANNYMAGNLLIGTTSNADGYKINATGTQIFSNHGFRLGTGYSAIDVATGVGGLYLSGAQGALNHIFIHSSGNTLLGSTTNSGEKLQVTGTMKVTGAAALFTTTITSTTNVEWTNSLNVRGGANGDNSGTRAFFRPSGSFGAAIYGGRWSSTDRGARLVGISSGSVENTYIHLNGESSIMQLATAATVRATLDASGNLGLGVTPSAWGGSFKALQVGLGTVLYNNSFANGTYLGSNYFYNGTNNIYILSNTATAYGQSNGQHQWFNAPSGTAGNAITFTQAMTLTAAGRLLLNQTSDTGEQLQVTGTAKITGAVNIGGNLTVDTNVLFVDTTNNRVGIGTAFPDHPLTIQTAGTGLGVRIIGYQGDNFLHLNNTLSTGNRTYQILAGITGIGYNGLSIYDSVAAQTRFVIDNSGNVGLGLTAPTERLHVSGNAIVTGNLTVDTNTLFVDATNNYVGIGTVTPKRNLDISTTGTPELVLGALSGGTDQKYWRMYAASDIFRIGNVNDAFSSGTDVLNINRSNNVGIGTISPLYKLHVNGTGYFNDNVRFPNQKGLLFVQTGGSLLGSISMDSGNAVSIDNNGFIGLSVGSNYNLLGGNTGIGTSTFGTSATRTFAVLNGTAPSTSPADTFQMYSADITSGNAAPHFRTENGAVIKLYQQDNGVAAADFVAGIGSPVTTLDIFDGYTIGQVVKALRNAGILS